MRCAPILETKVAHAGWDDHGFMGFDVFRELTGRISFTQLTVLASTGRLVSPEEAALIDDVAVVAMAADPRIWPLKIPRLVSAYGDPMSALAAANLWQGQAQVGFWLGTAAGRLLRSLSDTLGASALDPDAMEAELGARLDRGETLAGFGVPFRESDERLEAFRSCVERRGRERLHHWQVMCTLATAMKKLRGLQPNIALGHAAALLDAGFAPEQIGPLVVALGQNNFLANAVEGAAQAPAVLRRLPDACVRYEGPPPRRSPRALAAEDEGSNPSG